MHTLIADSGATKTDWTLVSSGHPDVAFQTQGFHPLYISDDELTRLLRDDVRPRVSQVEQIYFYGAGCAGGKACNRLIRALREVFGSIEIEVESDLLGAARALCGRSPGIACILGTGSNSCYFDGRVISHQIPALGFILGDEGGAGHLGKLIIQAYFYQELSEKASHWLESQYNMSKESIIENVYTKPQFNTFIASFARIFSNVADDDSLDAIKRHAFEAFITKRVLKYKDAQKHPVHFTGSTAWFNQAFIVPILSEAGLRPGTFQPSPMEGLKTWHSR